MSTIVIIIMIVCATVVSLVAIICDHLFEKKTDTSENYPLAKKIIKIHRNYIVGILGFAVIMLITARYGGPENAIFAYLSFASTITSLVLSILAIFVTVQSSSDLYKQFARIDDATNTIGKTLEKLTGTEQKLERTSNLVSTQMTNIVNEIDDRICKRFRELSEEVTSSINQHNQTIDKKLFQEERKQTSQMDWEKWEKGFIEAQSFIGILTLYACRLSFDKKRSFKMSELFPTNHQYVFGVIVTSNASGIIFAKSPDGNTVECTFSAFTKEQLSEKLENLLPQFTMVEKEMVNNINKYYEEPVK